MAVKNANYSDAQTAAQLVAAPSTGFRLLVDSLTISTDGSVAGTVKLVEDTAGTPTDIAGPYYFPAVAGIATIPFPRQLAVSEATDLGVTSTGASLNHTVTVSYDVGSAP